MKANVRPWLISLCRKLFQPRLFQPKPLPQGLCQSKLSPQDLSQRKLFQRKLPQPRLSPQGLQRKLFQTTPVESFEMYRAARRVARLTTLSSLVLAFVCVGLIGLLVALFPLKEVQPMLVTFSDRQHQVVRIEPLDRSIPGLQHVKEALCRQYVVNRETYDLQTEPYRWEQLALMSSPALTQEFRALVDPKKETSPYAQRLKEKATRAVRLVASTSLAPAAPDVFQVEWVSEDRHQGRLMTHDTWLTTLTVTLEERPFDPEAAFINPLGFTVTHYTVARKASVPLSPPSLLPGDTP